MCNLSVGVYRRGMELGEKRGEIRGEIKGEIRGEKKAGRMPPVNSFCAC